MKKFKTSEEGIKFFEDFICPLFGKATQMSDYWYNKLEKAGELKGNYKKKNEIIWDMFSDREDVIARIECDIHSIQHRYDIKTEEDKLDYLNGMLEEYEWYLQW